MSGGGQKKAGCAVPEFVPCTTEQTWGERRGLVFFGAPLEVCERAAKWFEKWVARHAKGSSYEAQSSIGYEGQFYFVRYSNGAQGWHRVWKGKELPVQGSVEKMSGIGSSGPWELKCEEVKLGYATSYVYFPCAE